MDKLLKQIEGLIIEKSLSLDVIEIVRNIQSEYANAIEDNKKLTENIKFEFERYTQEHEKLVVTLGELDGANTELTKYKAREKEFINSEHSHALKNKDVDSANLVLKEVKEVIGLVFKNTIIRERVNKSVGHMISTNGNYPTSHTTCDSETKDVEAI